MKKEFYTDEEVTNLIMCANGMGRIEGVVLTLLVFAVGDFALKRVIKKVKKETDSE